MWELAQNHLVSSLRELHILILHLHILTSPFMVFCLHVYIYIFFNYVSDWTQHWYKGG